MNAPSPWLRPLQFLAAALAVAIAALFVAWVRMEPPLAATAPESRAPLPSVQAAPASAEPHDAAGAKAATTAAAASEPAAPAPADTTAVLFGAVRRADGTPVTEGYCWLHRSGRLVGTEGLRNGTFAFAGLQPGVHRLTSRIPDELAIDREVVVRAPSTRVDVDLAARWLLSVNAVTAEGTPLVEAITKQKPGLFFRTLRALAFPEPLSGDLPSSASSELQAGLGPFRDNESFDMPNSKALPSQTIGVLTLPPDKPAHIALLLGSTLLAQQAAAPGQDSVTFVVGLDAVIGKTSTARFRCLDPMGAPMVGARVSIGSGGGMGSGPKMVTDAEGRYVARDLLPGRVSFGVYHKELRMPPMQIELAPGADVDLGDITLQKGVEVELSYANFGGEGIVRMFWLDAPANSPWRASDGYQSPQAGVSQKTSLFPGRYGLFARGKNGVALLELDTAALPPGPLRFDLRPGASLQIDNRIGAGFARFEIATPRGVPVHRGELGNRPGYAIELPSGDYVVTVNTGTGAPTRRAFTLPAGGTTLPLP